MLTRRLVRIKSLQALYSTKQNDEKSVNLAHKMFEKNVSNLQNAYYYAIQFIQALDNYLLSEIDLEKSKYFPDLEKIRTYSVFKNNTFLPIIDSTDTLVKRTAQFSADWSQEGEEIISIYNELKQQDFYKDYVVFDKPTFDLSKQFIIDILTFCNNLESYNTAMFTAFMTWEDDKKQSFKQVIESLKTTQESAEALSLYEIENEEHAEVKYGKDLIGKVIINEKELIGLVEKHTKNWDVERIAQTDQLIILQAIAEFLYFEDIPIKVTINEYLEVSKHFSTPQSSKFVNGILDSVKAELLKEDKISKSAKGLQE